MKKNILCVIILTLFSGHSIALERFKETDGPFITDNTREYYNYSIKTKKNDPQYKECINDWQVATVLGEFFNCIDPYMLKRKIEDNNEKFINMQNDSSNNYYLQYTSSNILPGSEYVTISYNKNGVFSINFSINTNSSSEANESMLKTKRQFVKLYGQPSSMKDYSTHTNTNNPYYFWDLNDKVKIYIKKDKNDLSNYILQIYNQEELLKALKQHLDQ